MTNMSQAAQSTSRLRIRVFIDYWNLQLTLNDRESEAIGQDDVRFLVRWKDFPGLVAGKAAELLEVSEFSYEGAIIYSSYNPRADPKFKNWLSNWLDRQPGIQVVALERRPKAPPRCPACHQVIETCPKCNNRIEATVEKGVDTAIATDMIRLAWEDAYDVAIVVSSDGDLVPAVKFLDQKGRKVIQAGFPPSGVQLATACWASFDLFALREEFRRP